MSETPTPATSPSTSASVDMGAFTVSSNSETSEGMAEVLKSDSEISKAAQKLGEKGGRAAAEARKIKPIPDKKVETAPEPSVEVKADDNPAKATPAKAEEGDPKHDSKARMLEATRQLAEERREKARLAAELEQFKAARTAPKEEEKRRTFKEDQSIEPDENDYENFGQYTKDMAAYGAMQAYQRTRQAEIEHFKRQQAFEKQSQHINSKIETWNENISKAWPDEASWKADGIDPRLIEWKTSLELGPNEEKGPHNAIADCLVGAIEKESQVEVMRYLSHHPEEVEKMLGMPSVSAIDRYMTRIEERVSNSAQKPKEKQFEVSKAPPPLRVAKSSPKASDGEEDLNELANNGHDPKAFDDYVRRRTAQGRR